MPDDEKKTVQSHHQKWLGWHFLRKDGMLRWGGGEVVKVGDVRTVSGQLNLCSFGLHASRRAIDALTYAPGPLVCRVQLSGEILEAKDKACASRRKVLAMCDAANVLHEFACRCAEVSLCIGNVTNDECWTAIEAKRAWVRGEIGDDELFAARDAAWEAAGAAARAAARVAAGDAAWEAARDATRDAAKDAARAAAWEAAWDAARAAAWDAARDAAKDAARDAAWDAARDAARAEENDLLETMLLEAMHQ